ncbi:MAG: glutamyl-tRNA reductase [Gammaproteobacteria bacterium]|nr:glutamyl-tRNA reductase [Gammaproteobacteria bacterium]|tara:strand:+ start:1903 stop:3147 length:1245 start_codon:yes stop_codon:yes gene_type:complete
MSINVIGLNHKTASINIREKLIFNSENIPLALKQIKQIDGVNEALILSTCNRTEIYTENSVDNKKVFDWLNKQENIKDCLPYTYNYENEDAINHLFHVASGMDSMVIGEVEILGQVKEAYKLANKSKTITSGLKRLFEFAFSVAKNIRTNTDIGSNPISFMFTSITLIKKIFKTIEDKKSLLIGSGEMISLAIKYLQSNKISQITLSTRNREKGERMAQENHCRFARLQDLNQVIMENDIIITSTSSSIPIIGKGIIESAIKNKNNKSIVIIDLGVPRDVEPEITDLDGVYLYTVDDLGKVIENNYKIRQQAFIQAEKIISYKIVEFKNWLILNKSNTLVKSYREYVDDITKGTIIKAKKMSEDGKHINEILDYVAESLKNKLTHETTSKLKEITPFLDEATSKRIKDIFKKSK